MSCGPNMNVAWARAQLSSASETYKKFQLHFVFFPAVLSLDPDIMAGRLALAASCFLLQVPCCGGLRRSVSGGDERDDEVEISTTITDADD